MGTPQPALLEAKNLSETVDIDKVKFDTAKDDYLEFDEAARKASWSKEISSAKPVPCWIPLPCTAHLHSGNFRIDFDVTFQGQIGIGFMLDWNVGVDWGFFGYLGASSSAWSYDPSTGDVVTATRSCEGGLPVLDKKGVVSLELQLPRQEKGSAMFIVNEKKSKPIELPVGAVCVPACCFLKKGQIVKMNITRE